MSQIFETKINKYNTSEDSYEDDDWDFYIYLDTDYERENCIYNKTYSTDTFYYEDDDNNKNYANDSNDSNDSNDANDNNNCKKFKHRILLYLFTGCLFTGCLFSACISAYFSGFTYENIPNMLSFGDSN